MKLKKYAAAAVLSAFTAANAMAQNTTAPEILPSISSTIGRTAADNIQNAERLFCYHVAKKPANYSGYTINGMAITGFCGVIDDNLKNMLTQQLFATDTNIDFINSEQCVIQPKILLRYVRGVDNTDVLLSAPCYSESVFYGGKVSTFNMKPAPQLIDTIVNAFNGSKVNFVSPALLNQLLPIGVPQDEQQKAVIEQANKPVNKWDTGAQNNNAPAAGGWNALK